MSPARERAWIETFEWKGIEIAIVSPARERAWIETIDHLLGG